MLPLVKVSPAPPQLSLSDAQSVRSAASASSASDSIASVLHALRSASAVSSALARTPPSLDLDQVIRSIDGDAEDAKRERNPSSRGSSSSRASSSLTRTSSSSSRSSSSSHGSSSSRSSSSHSSSSKNFGYSGPWRLAQVPSWDPQSLREPNENVVCEARLPYPPGLIAHVLFSDTDHTYWEKLLTYIEATNISQFTKFTDSNDNTRTFDYDQKLDFKIGPKQTRCYTTDTLLSWDERSFFHVLTTTYTPGLPAGQSFKIKTRYLFGWADSQTSLFAISYHIVWSSNSWFKSIIESNCKIAQLDIAHKNANFLKQYLDTAPLKRKSKTRSKSKSSSKLKLKLETPPCNGNENVPPLLPKQVASSQAPSQSPRIIPLAILVFLIIIIIQNYYILKHLKHSLPTATTA
ncbi:hypothetical protein TBLA_0D02360 [Henningerozyma blattae CBS 6284]|uniref:VASt domain-containing protein n=1 Tax=Henningerozyma blattae (strain ATCC 34711 / CBS 6284 / DSM 70876 / NBRC 10599 / NRRL Y-10934 / UCD 77-7) TaxID=1071380 RepID=I2H2Y8_HENB6|nr:hypothetical protein TBLA_0D02360 [Tetrapisispora blattae CBS 6284]CCH60740.1 hypothetical protein TBLA_0D02360 [Tetrapisispora blattae CBS 6284]